MEDGKDVLSLQARKGIYKWDLLYIYYTLDFGLSIGLYFSQYRDLFSVILSLMCRENVLVWFQGLT